MGTSYSRLARKNCYKKQEEEEDIDEEVEGGGNETRVKGDGTVVMVDHFS